MSMVINTNIQATRTHNVYNKNNDYMNQALTRVATGQKINSAKDGAANWAISEKMRERIRANDQANQNVQNDTALLKTAQGGIDNTIDILKTLKERALNSANDSNINTDRSAIATEVYQLLEQINDNAAKVKFNGRTLLNGDYDNGAADMFPVASTTAAEPSETDPNAVTVNSPQGTNAVYKLALADIAPAAWNGSATAAVTSDSKLVDLVSDSSVTNANKAAASKLFQDGDIITFSWNEDGEAKSFNVAVTSALTLNELATKFNANDDALKVVQDSAGTAALKDNDGKDITDSGEQKLYAATTMTSAAATGNDATPGIYIVGDKGVKITDLAVAVTYKDYDNDGATTNRTEAQAALEFTGVQQSSDPTTGSHSVFKIDSVYKVASGSSGAAATDTTVADLVLGGNVVVNEAFKFNVTIDGEEKEVSLATTDTVDKLITEFGKIGITVSLVGDGDDVLDSEGDKVTQNTLNGAEDLTASVTTTGGANTNNKALYFVADSGKTIDSITATSTNVDKISKVQDAGEAEEEAATDTSKSMTFHVGGEADFYMDINIKEMTTQSLLGADSKTFADNFMTKEGSRDIISTIDTAIQTALNEQTKLGAMESRLGYTSDNITTMNENLEAADSVYRDSDIAKEMTNYMKYTVLAQASQYMLAQTSQNAFSVLNLLQA